MASWIMRVLGGSSLALLVGASSASASSECFSSHAWGTGQQGFNVCFSAHGNLTELFSPAAIDQLAPDRREGYAICDLTGNRSYFDVGVSEDGFGEPIIEQPQGANTFPLEITRITTDKRLQLHQAFTVSPAARMITVTMTVTNLTRAVRNIRLSRIVKGDIDGDFGDDQAAHTHDTVFQWERGVPGVATHGLSLTTLSPNLAHAAFVQPYEATNNPCARNPTAVSTPTVGDYEGVLRHFLSIPPGESRTVILRYQRL